SVRSAQDPGLPPDGGRIAAGRRAGTGPRGHVRRPATHQRAQDHSPVPHVTPDRAHPGAPRPSPARGKDLMNQQSRTRPSGHLLRAAAVGATVALTVGACSSGDPLDAGGDDSPGTVVVGSQDYYSNEIIAEIY